MFNHLYSCLEKYDLFTKHQYEFIKKSSTVDIAIVDCTNLLYTCVCDASCLAKKSSVKMFCLSWTFSEFRGWVKV